MFELLEFKSHGSLVPAVLVSPHRIALDWLRTLLNYRASPFPHLRTDILLFEVQISMGKKMRLPAVVAASVACTSLQVQWDRISRENTHKLVAVAVLSCSFYPNVSHRTRK